MHVHSILLWIYYTCTYMYVKCTHHCISQQVTMEAFLTRFQWDSAKFPLRQPLPNIVDGISKVHASILYMYMYVYNVHIMYDIF